MYLTPLPRLTPLLRTRTCSSSARGGSIAACWFSSTSGRTTCTMPRSPPTAKWTSNCASVSSCCWLLLPALISYIIFTTILLIGITTHTSSSSLGQAYPRQDQLATSATKGLHDDDGDPRPSATSTTSLGAPRGIWAKKYEKEKIKFVEGWRLFWLLQLRPVLPAGLRGPGDPALERGGEHLPPVQVDPHLAVQIYWRYFNRKYIAL